MTSKTMICAVTVFALALGAFAEEQVAADLGKDTNSPVDASKRRKKTEINEINTVEKAKEAQVAKEVTADKKVDKAVAKEVSKDAATAKTDEEKAKLKAEKELKDSKTATKGGSSWFSWMWPFGSSDDEKAVSKKKAKEVSAKEIKAEKKVEKTVVKTVSKDVAHTKKDEKKAKAELEAKDSETESTWFAWLWPWGSSDDEKVEKAEKAENQKAVDVDIVEVKNVEKVKVNEPVPAVKKPQVAVKEPAIVAVKSAKANTKNDDSGIGRVLLMYFPNMLVDFTDIFSLGLSVGAKAGAEVRLTRWFQVGGNYGDDYFVEKGFNRQLGGGYDDGYSFQLVALAGESRYLDNTFGTVKDYFIRESKARVLSPSNEIYKNQTRDFWAIGVEGGWLVNVKALVHPVELADFVLGLFFIDILDDNIK